MLRTAVIEFWSCLTAITLLLGYHCFVNK